MSTASYSPTASRGTRLSFSNHTAPSTPNTSPLDLKSTDLPLWVYTPSIMAHQDLDAISIAHTRGATSLEMSINDLWNFNEETYKPTAKEKNLSSLIMSTRSKMRMRIWKSLPLGKEGKRKNKQKQKQKRMTEPRSQNPILRYRLQKSWPEN